MRELDLLSFQQQKCSHTPAHEQLAISQLIDSNYILLETWKRSENFKHFNVMKIFQIFEIDIY